MKLEGKVALITGGARGLGRAFGEEVLREGGKVALLDVLVDTGLDTANELNEEYGPGSVTFIKCDVRNKTEFEKAFLKAKEVYGYVDIVVNNAGIGGTGGFEAGWERVIDINLNAVIVGSYLALNNMRTDTGGKGGIIINISSTAGLTVAPFEPVYAASKHGVVGLSRSIAPTLEPLGIRVSCICPSFTNTEMVRVGLRREAGAGEVMKAAVDLLGLNKVSDVVMAFRHVVDTDDVTGDVITVTPKGMEYKFPKRLKGKL